MKGLRAKGTSIASAAALAALALGGGASCRSAQAYLDPRGPVYTGSWAPSGAASGRLRPPDERAGPAGASTW